MVITLNGHTFDTKDVCFLQNQDPDIRITLNTQRKFLVRESLDSFFAKTFLNKKDFVKTKKYIIFAKNIKYIGPWQEGEDEVFVTIGLVSGYFELSKMEHDKLIQAFKEVNNWKVIPKVKGEL